MELKETERTASLVAAEIIHMEKEWRRKSGGGERGEEEF